jgi:hypothetical protein
MKEIACSDDTLLELENHGAGEVIGDSTWVGEEMLQNRRILFLSPTTDQLFNNLSEEM